mmetsp:Transcript_10725/g.25616  ORF Transcript_10725/g.25616 Transcript_10725/m.25616 type:complete len:349 (+) Transcript_10725:873-1919(+)
MPGDDGAERVAVVRRHVLAVHLVRQHHVPRQRKGLVHGHGGEHLIDGDELHMLGANGLWVLEPRVQQHIPQPHAAELGRAHGPDVPWDALRLPDFVVVRSAVARALDGDDAFDLFELLLELRQRQLHRLAPLAADLELVVGFVDERHGVVVADEPELIRRHPVIHHDLFGEFGVAGGSLVIDEGGVADRVEGVRVLERLLHRLARSEGADAHGLEHLAREARVEVLLVDIPVRVHRLSSRHQNLRLTSRMPLDELCDVVHAVLVRHPHLVLNPCVLRHIRPGVDRQSIGLSRSRELFALLGRDVGLVIIILRGHVARRLVAQPPQLSSTQEPEPSEGEHRVPVLALGI